MIRPIPPADLPASPCGPAIVDDAADLCLAMTADTALETRKVPFRFTAMMRSQSSGVVLATVTGWVIPATFAS